MLLIGSSFDAGRAAGQIVAIVVIALLGVALLLRARRTRGRGYLLAGLVVVGALLAVNVVRVASRADDSWASQHGRELHAGFLSGCRQGAGGLVDCDCVFRRLTSAPPYDKPSGFEKLAGEVGGAVASAPPQYVAAIKACRR